MTRDDDDATASADGRLSTARLPIARTNCSWNAGRIAEPLQRVEGVVGDMGTSLGVTGNAMRLARIDPDPSVDDSAASREGA